MSIDFEVDVFSYDDEVGWSWFSDSISMGYEASYNGYFRLMVDGCQNTTAEADCASVCSSKGRLFQNRHTLVNCLRLASLSLIVQNTTNVTFASGSLESANGVYRFGNLSDFNGTGILDDFLTCVATSCELGPAEACTTQLLDLQHIPATYETIPVILDGVGSYCNISSIVANGDIAGPGVSCRPVSC